MKKYTEHQILCLSTAEVMEWQGRTAIVVLKDGRTIDAEITGIDYAAATMVPIRPYEEIPWTGIAIGTKIGVGDIKEITIKD